MKNFLLFLSLLFISFSVYADNFSDVPVSHKFYPAINSLRSQGIIKGYDDNTFRPNNKINRVEALKVLLLGSKVKVDLEKTETGFKDIKKSDWFAPYVYQAKSLAIIKGNPDNTFLPANNINLAETLKILLLTNGINTSKIIVEEEPFKDIKKSDWFAPYFVYAKEKKLLDQKSYEKVFPGENVNRAKFAELIYRLQNVKEEEKTNLSFASFYADYFEDKKTASGEKFSQELFTCAHSDYDFGTKLKVTNLNNQKTVIVTVNDRADSLKNRDLKLSKKAFSVISPLSLGLIPINYQEIKEEKKEEKKEEDTDKKTCEYDFLEEKIAKDFFYNEKENQKIILYQELNLEYQAGSVIDISGKVENENAEKITAFLKDSEGKKTIFSTKLKNSEFLLQIDLGKAEEKQLSLVVGDSGVNYLANIDVIDYFCEDNLKEEVLEQFNPNLIFTVEDNFPIIRWSLPEENLLTKIRFKQGNEEIIKYFLNKKGYKVNVKDFLNFSYGEAEIFFSVAKTKDNSFFKRISDFSEEYKKNIVLTKHLYSELKSEDLEIKSLPETYFKNGKIQISGRTKENIRTNLAIILPNGEVLQKKLVTETEIQTNEHQIKFLPKNSNFFVEFDPEIEGTYILEINNLAGQALLNVPVYFNEEFPVLPDFVDLREDYEFDLDFTQAGFSADLLNYVNKERKTLGLESLSLDESLNEIARLRVDDMKNNNYFSHWDLSSKDVNDLKINYGVKTFIGENIAQDVSLINAHYGLMRSAIHRENILSPDWEKAGFGFAKTDDNQLLVVELFTSNPISKEDLESLRDEVLELVNQKREKVILPSSSLDSIAQFWTEKMINDDFFDFEDLSGEKLSKKIREGGIDETVGTFIVGNSIWNKTLAMIKEHKELSNGRWQKLGVGIGQDNDGIIKVTLIYSE